MTHLYLNTCDNLSEKINQATKGTVIHLSEGVYRQKTLITVSDVTIVGEGNKTSIEWDDYAKKIMDDGLECNTFRTYTLCITGNNVTLKNLRVINTNTDPKEVGQCVALSVNADNFYAENVTLVSTQDTLFISPFPDDLIVRYRGFIPHNQLYCEGEYSSAFKNCDIYGTVDYIFGCGNATFLNCNIITTKDSRGTGYVCAPAHSLKQSYGFVFYKCAFINGGAQTASQYLARPWRDFGKCTFISCSVQSHISPILFDFWAGTERFNTARFLYYDLNLDFDATPVSWCRVLSPAEAQEIVEKIDSK